MHKEDTNKVAFRDTILNDVKAIIFGGDYAPGDPIREVDIAKRLGVSRVPVREVFRYLERDGLVEYIPNCGVHVKKLTKTDVKEIYSLRKMLDLFIADEVIDNITEADIEELKFLTQRMNDKQSYSLCNDLFHNKLFMLSGNSRIRQLWAMLEGQSRLIMNSCGSSHNMHQISVQLHQKILAALEAADKKAYEEAVRNHAEIALENILQMMEE